MKQIIFLVLFSGLCLNAQAVETPEKTAGGFGFTEGIAVTKDGDIFFTDFLNYRIYRMSSEGAVKVFKEDSGSANGLFADKNGSLYICEQNRQRITRLSGDKLDVIADSYEGKPFNSPNDIVVSTDGTVYFSDPSWNPRDPQKPGVYEVKDGKVMRIFDGAAAPNGVMLSPDEKILFIGDSAANKIFSYDLAKRSAALFTQVTSPDGMASDSRGNIYVAQYGVGKLQIFDSTGKNLRSIPLPEKAVSNCAVSHDEKTLFITAGHSVYKISLN